MGATPTHCSVQNAASSAAGCQKSVASFLINAIAAFGVPREPVIYRDATNAKDAGAFDKLTDFYGEHHD